MTTLPLGVITPLLSDERDRFSVMRDMGLTTCQVKCWTPDDVTPEIAEHTRALADEAGITISLHWAGYTGPLAWDYTDGPQTIGLVPREYRVQRVHDLKKGADIASWLGVTDIATHVGYLPMNAKDPDYIGTVDALKEVVEYCSERGIYFNFETGQETPVVLLRCIQDIGMPNVGINLDPANLLIYGNGNPVDALDIFGTHIRGVHAKDGEYPHDGYNLGVEKPLGQGRVNFPQLIPKLKAFGYDKPLTIEREISGPQQIIDIRWAIEQLTPLL